MIDGFTRLTPQNADRFLAIMQRLAARGPVQVGERNVVGGHPYHGRLTFNLRRSRGGAQILEACTPGGLVMNTPIMPEDYRPRRMGDAIAYYCIEGNVVTICCEILHLPNSTRTFQFS
jgi:hypothetical protein